MNKGTNIMVVESDGSVSKDIEGVLVKLGYTVLATARTGKEAIHEAAKYRLDLLLTDIFLEGEMDGIEAARKISSSFSVPVVFLSSSLDKETIERITKAGAYGIINKPIEERILQATIETALYRHKIEKRDIKELENTFDIKKRKSRNGTSGTGQTEDWTRTTFIIRKENLERIRALAYWERRQLKDTLDRILNLHFKDKTVLSVAKGEEES
jgi:CheY-like chemotaxis protein